MSHVSYETSKVKELEGGDRTLEVKEQGRGQWMCGLFLGTERHSLLRCCGQGPCGSCDVAG